MRRKHGRERKRDLSEKFAEYVFFLCYCSLMFYAIVWNGGTGKGPERGGK